MPDGIPSPNPDFPQQIKNVTGNANVKIQNKNLFDGALELGIYSGSTGQKVSNDEYVRNSNFIEVNELTNYKFSNDGVGISLDIYEYKEDYSYNLTGTKLVNSTSHLTTESGTKYITFRTYAKTTDTNMKIQLEQGTTATSYVEHQEQNYPFTFSEGQRGMQGTTLQDDGIHHKRARVDLSTLTWTQYATNKYQSSSLSNVIKKPTSSTIKANILAEKYIVVPQSASFTNGVIGIGTNGAILCMDETGTPSGILEYELSEEAQKTEIIPYNETQQAQYDNIKANAHSYDDITIISSTSDELGFNMKAIAVADANKVIDSLDTRLLALESEV